MRNICPSNSSHWSFNRVTFRIPASEAYGLCRRTSPRSLLVLGCLVLLSTHCIGSTGNTPASPNEDQIALSAIPKTASRPVCDAAPEGYARCHSVFQTAADRQVRPSIAPVGYGPTELRSAYAVPDGGAGATIAIVAAFDNPIAESDLAGYRERFGLRACTTASGCFRKVNQRGAAAPLPATHMGWAAEISLDLDMASAICPACNLLLVEADSNHFDDLGAAVNTAVALGATAISNSYGAPERSWNRDREQNFYHPGILITVSSGDSGYGVEYPAASQWVLAVGGTSLVRSSSPRGWAESAWLEAGSGCSAYITKPYYQLDSGCSKRSVADVSAVADPATGVAVYDTYNAGGWTVAGGTSVAAPIVAAAYVANQRAKASPGWAYMHPSAFHDVTTGSNGSCGGSYLCTAGSGYDGPTGVGTPKAFPPEGGTSLELVGQYATWCGKVNTHIDGKGDWVPDADCTSGCEHNTVDYCKKLWPSATVQIRTPPTGAKNFPTRMCAEEYPSVGEAQFGCFAPSICGDGFTLVGEYATWCGKVNAHTDGYGSWLADADCSSGCENNTVAYCQKFWPLATKQVVRRNPTPEKKPFFTAGCELEYDSPGQKQIACCARNL